MSTPKKRPVEADAEKAKKADAAKPPMHLLHPLFVVEVAAVLAHGARKYGAWNWLRGKELSRDYAAALRHMNAWWGGQDLDPESGLPHLAHAAACLMIVYVTKRLDAAGVVDDRPVTP